MYTEEQKTANAANAMVLDALLRESGGSEVTKGFDEAATIGTIAPTFNALVRAVLALSKRVNDLEAELAAQSSARDGNLQ